MEQEIQMLAWIVKYLVDHEDDVRIQRDEKPDWTINLILTTHKDDIWRVIWKNWNIVWAIRTLLKLLWIRMWKKIILTIVEPDKI